MTLEEAISRFRNGADKQVKWSKFTFDYELLLHEIYDDFENKICKNCKYLNLGNYGICNYVEPLQRQCLEFDTDDFGCNKFKRKD